MYLSSLKKDGKVIPRILVFNTFVKKQHPQLHFERQQKLLNDQEKNDLTPELSGDIVVDTLRNTFQLQHFRDNQREIIDKILSGCDVFVKMPTGSGKTLCFAIPAVISAGITLVIVPFNALMADLNQRFNKHHILTKSFNQFTTDDELSQVLHDLNSLSPSIKILITTPESIKKPAVQMALQGLNERKLLSRVIIDEVHCLSEASDQFRPEYLELNKLKDLFPRIQLVMLTATASDETLSFILDYMKATNCTVFRIPVTRTNITYKVFLAPKKKQTTYEHIKEYIIKNFSNMCGIVYCNTPTEVLDLSYILSNGYQNQLSVSKYSGSQGDMDIFEKQKELAHWLEGKTKILVSTKAAGTGLDKNNVRFVINCGLPNSVEEYYQQTGRCGRDGLNSEAIMFFRPEDRGLHIKHIGQETTEFRQLSALRRLHSICQYAEMHGCRKQFLSQYFSDPDTGVCQNQCDYCLAPLNLVEVQVNIHTQNIVGIIQSFCLQGKKPTFDNVTLVFRGANNAYAKKENLHLFQNYGKGKGFFTDNQCKALIRYLVWCDFIKENIMILNKFSSSYLSLTTKGQNLLQGSYNQPIIWKQAK